MNQIKVDATAYYQRRLYYEAIQPSDEPISYIQALHEFHLDKAQGLAKLVQVNPTSPAQRLLASKNKEWEDAAAKHLGWAALIYERMTDEEQQQAMTRRLSK